MASSLKKYSIAKYSRQKCVLSLSDLLFLAISSLLSYAQFFYFLAHIRELSKEYRELSREWTQLRLGYTALLRGTVYQTVI
jgi:hypothetical protein